LSSPDYTSEIPLTVRYHHEAIDKIIQCVEQATYCAVLGPRLCGKTVLLRFVENQLTETLGWTCLYIDLKEIRASTQANFFADLISQTADLIHQQTGQVPPQPEPFLASSAVFRGFLMEILEVLQLDLVMIVDSLDVIPTDLAQALLTSLRAAYMDQQSLDYNLTVVVSGALSLATLTVGESSPFRGIARRVFVGDLSADHSRALIAEYLESKGVSYTRQAQQRLLDATSGDTYLIRQLCQYCVEAIHQKPNPRLGARTVDRVTRAFLRRDVYQYAPLLEAVRLIEENPDLLRCLLVLLELDTVPKSQLPLPLSPDLDPLYLTGVVEQVDGDYYRMQNTIYRYFLAEHFKPGRVGHILSMAGLWDAALDYLESGIAAGDLQSRADLLPATIQSIYAAQDLAQAAHFLSRGLIAGFGACEIQVWYTFPGENRLHLIANAGEDADPGLWTNPEMSLQADRLEARAFRQSAVLRGGESRQSVQRAVPLLIPGRNPVGVVMVRDESPSDQASDQRERDLQLIGYLNQAARALQVVGNRRQELALAGRMQASLMPETLPDTPGWQLSATWRPARETSGDFYDFIDFNDGRLGVILADVTDKGMGAALYMALSRTLLRTYADEHPDRPGLVMRAANQRMLADTHGGLFTTLFYGLLDTQSGVLTYCNAGHPPPYRLSTNQHQKPEALHRTGMPLGISPEATWSEGQIQLVPGDLLLLYTDGLIETHNSDNELFGDNRMLEISTSLKHRSARHVQDALVSEVRAFTGNEQQFDDLTLVLIKRDK
jgi:serine phosphatase RsbU (regulator of sigma subunit)